MGITQAVCNSFKQQLLEGIHDFETGGDTFKLALYNSSANLSAATTVYTSTNEVSPTGQYSTGGGTLTGQQTSLDTGVAIVTFSDLSFTGVTLTAAGALIYNNTESNKAVCALNFGGDKAATAGTFTIIFPSFTSTNAILRIS
jgi:hypothetical protein